MSVAVVVSRVDIREDSRYLSSSRNDRADSEESTVSHGDGVSPRNKAKFRYQRYRAFALTWTRRSDLSRSVIEIRRKRLSPADAR